VIVEGSVDFRYCPPRKGVSSAVEFLSFPPPCDPSFGRASPSRSTFLLGSFGTSGVFFGILSLLALFFSPSVDKLKRFISPYFLPVFKIEALSPPLFYVSLLTFNPSFPSEAAPPLVC